MNESQKQKKLEETIKLLQEHHLIANSDVDKILLEIFKYLPPEIVDEMSQVYTNYKLSELKSKIQKNK